jgi:hypothetical protein
MDDRSLSCAPMTYRKPVMRARRLVDFPYVLVRLRCDACKRAGSYRLARLAVKYGAEIFLDDLIVRLSADCPWRDDPRGDCGLRPLREARWWPKREAMAVEPEPTQSRHVSANGSACAPRALSLPALPARGTVRRWHARAATAIHGFPDGASGPPDALCIGDRKGEPIGTFDAFIHP